MTKTAIIPPFNEKRWISFWSKADLKANICLCWNWKGYVRSEEKPYGRFDIGGKGYSASRISLFLRTGTQPFGLHALHTCDNPRCVNPNHLFWGTNDDNVRDKVSKNRQSRKATIPKGTKRPEISLWSNPTSKMNEAQYHEVVRIYKEDKLPLWAIAEKFGVSRTAISKTIKRMGEVVSKRTQLTEQQVLEIRKKYNKEIGNGVVLSREYGIGKKTVLDIIHRVTWKHLI